MSATTCDTSYTKVKETPRETLRFGDWFLDFTYSASDINKVNPVIKRQIFYNDGGPVGYEILGGGYAPALTALAGAKVPEKVLPAAVKLKSAVVVLMGAFDPPAGPKASSLLNLMNEAIAEFDAAY